LLAGPVEPVAATVVLKKAIGAAEDYAGASSTGLLMASHRPQADLAFWRTAIAQAVKTVVLQMI
jgi:hypothetical protein